MATTELFEAGADEDSASSAVLPPASPASLPSPAALPPASPASLPSPAASAPASPASPPPVELPLSGLELTGRKAVPMKLSKSDGISGG